jgi:hypothetical protein
MADSSAVNDLIPFIFGAGGVAFLGACVQGYKSLKDSAEVRESKALRNIERWSDDCTKALAQERRMGAHWWRCVGILQYHIALNGLEQPPLPDPPSEPDEKRNR